MATNDNFGKGILAVPSVKPRKAQSEMLRASTGKAKKGKSKAKPANPLRTDRKTVILGTPGELLSDLCPDWLAVARDNASENYSHFDTNVPRSLPPRSEGIDAYLFDSPLTEMAYLEAKLLGHNLARQGMAVPKDVWSAPEYACVQSASAFLKGMDSNSSEIMIEPALCDIGSRYTESLEPFMEEKELRKAHVKVDTDYSPLYSIQDISRSETLQQFYQRGKKTIEHVVRSSKNSGAPILVVGPRANLEVWSRGLTNSLPKDPEIFERILNTITPNALIFLEQDPKSKRWSMVEPPLVATMTHSANASFDWRIYDHVNL